MFCRACSVPYFATYGTTWTRTFWSNIRMGHYQREKTSWILCLIENCRDLAAGPLWKARTCLFQLSRGLSLHFAIDWQEFHSKSSQLCPHSWWKDGMIITQDAPFSFRNEFLRWSISSIPKFFNSSVRTSLLFVDSATLNIIFVRDIKVENLGPNPRKIKIFKKFFFSWEAADNYASNEPSTTIRW